MRTVRPLTEEELTREAQGFRGRIRRAPVTEVPAVADEVGEGDGDWSGAATVAAAVVLLPLALVALALGGGGLLGGVRRARYHMYNSARWLGNVQPWLELSPTKIARRHMRRLIGRRAGRLFSWGKWFV